MKPSDRVAALETALQELVQSMHLVLDHDWHFTMGELNASPPDHTIRERGTFLRPGVEDESNNWANRGGLLSAYRDAVKALKDAGLSPTITEFH